MTDSPCKGHRTAADHDTFMDGLAAVITGAAVAAHPGDESAATACALAAADKAVPYAVRRVCRMEPGEATAALPLAPGEHVAPTGVVVGSGFGPHGDRTQAAADFAAIQDGRL